jgi:2-amino-4-hydroxy-6-hydroxymethyldihydropteridine diphosphokinase
VIENVLSHNASIALGANLGKRREAIERAIEALRATPGIAVERVSTLIETEPVGGPANQPKYLNGAAALRTSLVPRELLNALLSIERNLGRDRSSGERNAPRAIDLDLLLYDELVISEADLIIPHPRMHEREFVLHPMAEIAPNVRHPVLKMSVRELLAAI